MYDHSHPSRFYSRNHNGPPGGNRREAPHYHDNEYPCYYCYQCRKPFYEETDGEIDQGNGNWYCLRCFDQWEKDHGSLLPFHVLYGTSCSPLVAPSTMPQQMVPQLPSHRSLLPQNSEGTLSKEYNVPLSLPPLKKTECRYSVMIVDSIDVLQSALFRSAWKDMLEKDLQQTFPVVGLDGEWVSTQSISLIQVASLRYCFFFHLTPLRNEWLLEQEKKMHHKNNASLFFSTTKSNSIKNYAELEPAPWVPLELQTLLVDPTIFKSGAAIKGDQQRIHYDLNIYIPLASCIDLGLVAKRSGFSENIGLGKLTRDILGADLQKSLKITLSDWDRRPLTSKQVAYARDDACASLLIFYFMFCHYYFCTSPAGIMEDGYQTSPDGPKRPLLHFLSAVINDESEVSDIKRKQRDMARSDRGEQQTPMIYNVDYHRLVIQFSTVFSPVVVPMMHAAASFSMDQQKQFINVGNCSSERKNANSNLSSSSLPSWTLTMLKGKVTRQILSMFKEIGVQTWTDEKC